MAELPEEVIEASYQNQITVRQPVKIQTGQDEECYFCNVVMDDPEGVIYYRVWAKYKPNPKAKLSFRWLTVPVCEQCWRVAEEVRGWFE